MAGESESSKLLEGRTALITGGARGIGRAVVERFLSAGALTAVVDILDLPPLGEPTLNFRFDLADVRGLPKLVSSVEAALGRIDILVNNAAILREEPLFDLSYDAYRRVVAVNLDAPILLALAAARGMVDRGYGRIVNVTSVQGEYGFERALSYGVSKAGLNNATRVLAAGLSRSGVLVNAVAPGFMAVEMPLENACESGTSQQEEPLDFESVYLRNGRIPIGRAAAPSEIAKHVAWLASEQNSYVTGHVLVIDGGLTATF